MNLKYLPSSEPLHMLQNSSPKNINSVGLTTFNTAPLILKSHCYSPSTLIPMSTLFPIPYSLFTYPRLCTPRTPRSTRHPKTHRKTLNPEPDTQNPHPSTRKSNPPSLLLSSLELSDTTIYEPEIQALHGTASHVPLYADAAPPLARRATSSLAPIEGWSRYYLTHSVFKVVF